MSGKIVLGNSNVKFLDFPSRRILPSGQPHVLILGVGAIMDKLRRCLAMDSPVQLVLHRGEKTFRCLRCDVIVCGSCVNVGNFLIEHALGEADFPDALQLLFKILIVKDGTAAFQAFVIH